MEQDECSKWFLARITDSLPSRKKFILKKIRGERRKEEKKGGERGGREGTQTPGTVSATLSWLRGHLTNVRHGSQNFLLAAGDVQKD